MSIESLFPNNQENQNLQPWWSTFAQIDFDAINDDDGNYHQQNLQEPSHNDTTIKSSPFDIDQCYDEQKPSSSTCAQIQPEPINSDGLVRVVNYRSLEDNVSSLFNISDIQDVLPTFIEFMAKENINDTVSKTINHDDDDSGSSQERIYDSIDSRDNHAERWNRHFQDLQDFHSEFGHCIVPNNYQENPSLAQWVKRQRHQHKLKITGKRSTLTPERQSALDKLGFVWSAQDAMWEERFKELEDFKTFFGHCNVPSKFSQNPKLSIWVKSQRRQCKLYQRNEPSFITEDRFMKLKSVGFDWNPRNL